MHFMRHRITAKSIEVSPEEFARFRTDYVANRKWRTNRVFIRGWVIEKDVRGVVKIVVADKLPPEVELTTRLKRPDEMLPESRRDTIWGELKVAVKSIARDPRHHLSVLRAQIVGLPSDQFDKLQVGESFAFEIGPRPSSWPFAVVAMDFFGIRASANIEGQCVTFSDWVNDRSRVVRERFVCGVVGIISLVAWPLRTETTTGVTTIGAGVTTMAASVSVADLAGSVDALPPALAKEFEGCPADTSTTFTLHDGAYSAFCIEQGYGATGPRVKWWAESGKKFRAETWNRGVLVGVGTSWDRDGRLLSTESYGGSGLLDGETTVYDHDEGQIIVQQWKAGKKTGESKKSLTKRKRP
jgi:hypothetical protein